MISVIAAGSDRKHSKYFVVNRPAGLGVYDLVLFITKTVIEIDGELVVIKPNTMILFDRTFKQCYYSNEEYLINDFIHFDLDSESEKNLLEKMVFNKPFQIEQIDIIRNIIKCITYEYNNAYPNRELNMEYFTKVLLKKVEEEIYLLNKHGSYETFARFVSIKSKIRQNPQENWTIKRLAEECKMSRSHFQATYKKLFGTNCISDVIHERLIMARRLVCTSSLPVHEIAMHCGYENVEHFSRQFKKVYGITPLKFRKAYYNGNSCIPVELQDVEEVSGE